MEVTKEVPIEKVVEKIVEVTKEVPVEKIVIKEVVKEVPVDKIVYVTDQEEMKAKIFQKDQELEEQRRTFSTKTQEMENIFQENLTKKEKELDELRKTLDEHTNKPPIEKVVEIIKEVPVEKVVIQEVIIEKDVSLDKSKIDALQNTISKLRQENIDKEKVINELNQTIINIQNSSEQRRAMYLDGSNLNKPLIK